MSNSHSHAGRLEILLQAAQARSNYLDGELNRVALELERAQQELLAARSEAEYSSFEVDCLQQEASQKTEEMQQTLVEAIESAVLQVRKEEASKRQVLEERLKVAEVAKLQLEGEIAALKKEGDMDSTDLLALPDGVLRNILSFSLPEKECQIWEWIGILGLTCQSMRLLAQSFAPSRLMLADFMEYEQIGTVGGDAIDARIGILQSIQNYDWRRQHLKELHINWRSVLNAERRCEEVRVLLRVLLTTPASLPGLEWLDINLNCDQVDDYDLVNSETFPRMPSALPSLKKLCLCNCFEFPMNKPMEDIKVSPRILAQFFLDLGTPLESLSLGYCVWMTDAHVEAVLPLIGGNLVRLELIHCVEYDDIQEVDVQLSDRSLQSIGQYCSSLKSFAMTDTAMTSFGLRHVLSANPNIVTLNLSINRLLGTTTIEDISRYLPMLRELRIYWGGWLYDDTLKTLVQAQERYHGGQRISLNLIGVGFWDLRSDSILTITGLKYAIKLGVKEIEIEDGRDLGLNDPSLNLTLHRATYPDFVDGSDHDDQRS